MMSLNAVPAIASQLALPRPENSAAASDAASANSAAKATEARNAVASLNLTGPVPAMNHAMTGMSTVEVAGAMGSLPAVMGRLREIVMASSNPALSEADRSTLQAEYSALTHQVASVVGSATASADSTGTAHKGRDSSGSDSRDREPGGDHAGGGRQRPSTPGSPAASGGGAATSGADPSSRGAEVAPTPAPLPATRPVSVHAASAVAQFVPAAPLSAGRVSLLA